MQQPGVIVTWASSLLSLSAGSLTWKAMNCGLPSFFSMITAQSDGALNLTMFSYNV
jgi:hypothetical protein